MAVSLARPGLIGQRGRHCRCSPPSRPLVNARTPQQTHIDSFRRRRVCRARAGQKRLPGGTDENNDNSEENGASGKQQQQRKQRFGFGFGNRKKAQATADAAASSTFEGDLTLDEELVRAPLRPWKDFFSDNAGIPPTGEAWAQRIRLNFNYYSTNYALITSAVTLFVGLRHPSVFIGAALSLLAGFVSSRFWVATLAPAFQALTGMEVALFTDIQGKNKELVITSQQDTNEVGSRLLSVAEKRILLRESATKLAVGMSLASTFLLISTPLRTVATLATSTIVAALLNFLHASLVKPNMGSSIAGLGSVRTRSELDQNLRTLWDVATGNNRRS